MEIDRLFSDRAYLEKEIAYFTKKKHIRTIEPNPDLIQAHINKARHNLRFYHLNRQQHSFNDWLIVTLYYTLYHAALALITNRNHASKNHYATILLLIEEYHISPQEAQLLEELSLNKEDAQLYTRLKEERKEASYSTSTRWDEDTIEDYEEKVMEFLNKTEELLNQ